MFIFFNQWKGNIQFLQFEKYTAHQQKVEFDAIPPDAFKIKLKASSSLVSTNDPLIFASLINSNASYLLGDKTIICLSVNNSTEDL